MENVQDKFLKAALWYRKKGLSVIPCRPKTKNALVSWKQYQTQLPTKQQIRTWWTQTPDANIAVVLGEVSNVITLEIDDEKAVDGHIPITPQAISGGKELPHIYFRYPKEGMRNHKAHENGRELFSTRGNGEYVLVPPSIHPSSNPYKWAYGLRIDQVEIAHPPDWVLELIRPEKEREPEIDSNQHSKPNESAWQIKREKIIEIIRNYWKEGQRQELAMCLGGFLAKQKEPWPDAANLILEIAALCGDSETRQRMAAIKQTYEKAQKGQEVKGYKGLEEILSPGDLRTLTGLFDSPRVQVVEADEGIEGEKSIKKLDLDFPEKVYETGIFKIYVESFKYSETPPQFYFSTLASYLGLRLGRDVYTYYPRPVYPNLYICNVAPTGNKKSTGGYLYDLSKDIPQNEFQIISGISSPEGLVSLFTEEVKKNERIAIPEKQILIIQNELTTIFKKGERQVTSTLLEYLNDFYDYLPYIDVPTKQNPLRAERPCLGILSSTTLGAFEKILTEHHVRMGFLNRFCFFIGEVSEPVANPSMPNKDVMDLIGKELNKILKFAKKLREKSKNEIELSEGAKELWQSYYNDLFHEKDNLSELEIEIAERTHVFARKFAVLYAIAKESCIVKEDDDINRAPLIDEDDLYRACLIADYLKSSARYLITKLGETKYTRLEERLLKYLKENRGRAFSISTLRKVAGGYYSRFEVLTALKNLSYEGVKIVQQKGITYYGFF